MMTMDREMCIAREVMKEIVEGAACKGDHGAALGADEVVPVSRLPDHVGGVTAGLEQARQEIDGRQDLQRPIDSGTPDRGEFLDQLLGGKGAAVAEDSLNNLAPWIGQPVSVVVEDPHDVICSRDLLWVGMGSPVHGDEA
jgi:hypothetical protein